MKNFFYFVVIFSVFFLIGCSPKAGIDPHLSVEEKIEIKQEFNSLFVGKWNIENNSDISSKSIAQCYINSLEFTSEGNYILKVSDLNDSSKEPRFFNGVYLISFDESDPTKVEVDKIFLMQENYSEEASLPQAGSVATFDSIKISEQGDLSFNIIFGQQTSDFCNIGQNLSIDAKKEEPIVSDAPEDSNHFKIQKKWRLIRIDAQSAGNGDTTAISDPLCKLFEEEWESRCVETPENPTSEGCYPSNTVVITFTGYGTYLWAFYDVQGKPVHFEDGRWRWVEKSPQDYSQFEVDFDQSQEYNQIISIVELSDDSFVVEERQEETVNGVTFELIFKYGFQPSKFNYTPESCNL